MIDVSAQATSGNGSAASPWCGWDAIIWAPETEYYFPSGVYSYSQSPNFLQTGIALRGEAGTVLKYTGNGHAVIFDNPGTAPQIYARWTQNVRMENFIIQGNANAMHGILLRGVRNGIFRHISVRDVTGAGIWTEACVTNILDNFRVTHHEMPNDVFNTRPQYGIVFAARGADTTTTWVVTNAVVEGTSQVGIWVRTGCYGNRFIGGTSEGNLGKGMVLEGHLNAVDGMDFEANTSGVDVEIAQSSNALRDVYSAGLIDVKAGQMNRVQGRLRDVRIAVNCDFTDVSMSYYTGTLTDLSLSTTKYAYQLPAGFQYGARIGKAQFGPT